MFRTLYEWPLTIDTNQWMYQSMFIWKKKKTTVNHNHKHLKANKDVKWRHFLFNCFLSHKKTAAEDKSRTDHFGPFKNDS